jgi:hypothetical protein
MMTGFERYTKKTKRAAFLEEMEQVGPLSTVPKNVPNRENEESTELLLTTLIVRILIALVSEDSMLCSTCKESS